MVRRTGMPLSSLASSQRYDERQEHDSTRSEELRHSQSLLNSAQAPGAGAPFEVELALILDGQPEVVLGLPPRRERAAERGRPAVEVACHGELLDSEQVVRHVVGCRVVEAPR